MALTNKYKSLDECLSTYVEWYLNNQKRVVDVPSCLRFLRLATDGRLFLIHLMRDQLVPLRDSFTDSDRFDEALDKFTNWYETNVDEIEDVVLMVKFLKKSTDDTLHLIHLLRDEVAKANQHAIRETGLWLPSTLVNA